MADHYLQFSEALTSLSDSEVDWLQQQLETVYVFDDQEFTEQDVPAHLSPDAASWSGLRVFRDLSEGEFDGDVGFEYALRNDEESGQFLWIYAEDNGQLDQVAHLVQKFLNHCRSATCWWLTYATTCSKPRIGEFAGGAMFVTADDVELFYAGDFVEQQRALFAGRSNPNLNSERDSA